MKLPNAPLSEVVFELRWELEGAESVPIQLRRDPAYPLLAYQFAEEAKRHGFPIQRDLSGQQPSPLGHSIQYRYFRAADVPFPLWQIGPGIFAYNESTDYEWNSYRESLQQALNALLTSYPKTKAFRMRPIHLELRYVDVFDHDLLGHTDLEKFLQRDTTLSIDINDFFYRDNFDGPFVGRLDIRRRLKTDRDSYFNMVVSTGESDGRTALILISKVFKQSDNMDLGNQARFILGRILKWTDIAHDLTHNFFWDLIGDELMRKFKE
jgi:uncharacterized protein (TIGR04255 family)